MQDDFFHENTCISLLYTYYQIPTFVLGTCDISVGKMNKLLVLWILCYHGEGESRNVFK